MKATYGTIVVGPPWIAVTLPVLALAVVVAVIEVFAVHHLFGYIDEEVLFALIQFASECGVF